MVGDVFASEQRRFKDPETGAAITQHTSLGKTNRSLYFTNRPYVCDGEHAVFLSDRTGRNEMFMLHLKSGKIVQLTDLPGQLNVANCLHPTRPELYFKDSRSIWRVRLDTLKSEELLRAPEGFRTGILNLNSPPWLCFEMLETRPHGLTKARGAAADAPSLREQFFFRDAALIYRYNVDTDELDCVWGERRMLTHVQISPTQPDFLIFSDFAGYGQDRCQYLDLGRRMKSPPRPTFPESATARANHECFTRRGTLYAQWMEGDLERDGDHKLFHAFLKTGDVPAGEFDRVRLDRFEKYELPERNKDLVHHFTMSNDETWGVHDRWLTAPTWEENISFLSVFRHQKEHPQTVVKKLCFHNGFAGDEKVLGAELAIDDADRTALYTSFLGGSANVCQVDLRPFVEGLMEGSR